MITVTATAADKLKEILVEEGQPEAALRVIVVPNGSGAQYMLTLENEAQHDDIIMHENGVRVLVDNGSVELLEGAEIDYMEGLMRSGFVINNPNVQASDQSCGSGGCGSGGCGCGEGGCGCGH